MFQTARDIMTQPLVTLLEDMNCREAMKILSDENISGAPVVNEAAELVGVISIKDLLLLGDEWAPLSFYDSINTTTWAENRFEVPDDLVSNRMTSFIHTVKPSDSIQKVAKILYDQHIHRIMVVEDKQPIGIITTFDLLKLLITEQLEKSSKELIGAY